MLLLLLSESWANCQNKDQFTASGHELKISWIILSLSFLPLSQSKFKVLTELQKLYVILCPYVCMHVALLKTNASRIYLSRSLFFVCLHDGCSLHGRPFSERLFRLTLSRPSQSCLFNSPQTDRFSSFSLVDRFLFSYQASSSSSRAKSLFFCNSRPHSLSRSFVQWSATF